MFIVNVTRNKLFNTDTATKIYIADDLHEVKVSYKDTTKSEVVFRGADNKEVQKSFDKIINGLRRGKEVVELEEGTKED